MIKEYKQKHYNFVNLKKKKPSHWPLPNIRRWKPQKNIVFFFFTLSSQKLLLIGYVREYVCCSYGEGIYGEQYFQYILLWFKTYTFIKMCVERGGRQRREGGLIKRVQMVNNWWIWVKSTWEFPALLKLLNKFEVTSK